MSTPFCTLCGQWFDSMDDIQPPGSYCKVCWRRYQKWRYRQRQEGLNSTIAHYRYVFDKPKCKPYDNVPEDEKMGRLKECPICFHLHDVVGSYCKPCKSAYVNWSKQRRRRGLTALMSEFRDAVDNGSVRPRLEGTYHIGKVVRDV